MRDRSSVEEFPRRQKTAQEKKKGKKKENTSYADECLQGKEKKKENGTRS
jgi:hypothetical protein